MRRKQDGAAEAGAIVRTHSLLALGPSRHADGLQEVTVLAERRHCSTYSLEGEFP